MAVARRNAKRLAEDARLLFDAGRFASAASLAVLSIEEHAKTHILRGLTAAKNQKALKEGWKEYRNHKAKNFIWLRPVMIAEGAKTIQDLEPMHDPKNVERDKFEVTKQLGFYSDAYGNCEWWEPGTGMKQKLAELPVVLAEHFCEYRDTSEREMELWLKYLGDESLPATPEVVLELYKAMIDEGIASGPIELVEKLLGLSN